VPNFENPRSRRTELLITNVVCLSLAGIFVAMRIYTKSFLSRKMAQDDGLWSPLRLCDLCLVAFADPTDSDINSGYHNRFCMFESMPFLAPNASASL
jgi:hypothetical protein